jgi:hypothetical protein
MQQRPTDDALYRAAYRDVESQMPLPPGYLAEADVKTPKLPLDVYSGKQIASYDYRRTPVAEWANETPGGWNDVLPLLSRKNAAKGE